MPTVRKFVVFMLLKCGYGDSQHIQENKDHYMGTDANATRRQIYQLWRSINKLDSADGIRWKQVGLNLDRYLLINASRDTRMMSTQLTGNTCYFQTYLFGVLCKVGKPALSSDGNNIDLQEVDPLEVATVHISQLLLEFFHDVEDGVMRPLTNSNVVLDFHRYHDAAYYDVITRYLRSLQTSVPTYELQYQRLMDYFKQGVLHQYDRFEVSATMSSTLNTKSLQPVCETDDGVYKLARSSYYKYRAANLTFGFNTGITGSLSCFAEFNALRKNQLLAFYPQLQPLIAGVVEARRATSKYRDYYFMAQFEVGQRELVDLHHLTYEIDLHSLLGKTKDKALTARIHAVNTLLAEHVYFSTQRLSDYDKFTPITSSRKFYDQFLDSFMSAVYWQDFLGLGLSQIVPAEKEINSLTQTAFYSLEMMSRQAWRMEYEFEKECINQMARSTLRQHQSAFSGSQSLDQKYSVAVKIGHGVTYSKYNTLMHFLNVAQAYWHNPDVNSIQVFLKDRAQRPPTVT